MTRGSAGSLALLAWAGLFCFLWASGEAGRFLGPRTYWVVPFGAVALLLLVLTRLLLGRRIGGDVGQRLTRREAVGHLVLLCPVIVVCALPDANLGAVEASQRMAQAPPQAALADEAGAFGERENFLAVSSAAYYSPTESRRFGALPGRDVFVSGFVTEDKTEHQTEGTTTILARFVVLCCAADAWLSVSGQLERSEDGDLIVRAAEAWRTAEPDDPYLSAAR